MKQFLNLQTTWLLTTFILLDPSSLFEVNAGYVRDDLPFHVLPTRYILRLKPLPSDDMYIGYVKISILCVSNTSSIVLHADPAITVPLLGITVREPGIYRNEVPDLIPIANLRRHSQTSHLIITLEKQLVQWATYELKIHFTGKLTSPEDGDFFKGKYTDEISGKEKWYIGTKLKPGTARKMFPCFDETDYKATFSISIARSKNSQTTILSNTKMKSVTKMKGAHDWIWENFDSTPRILPSSIGIAIFEFDEVVSGNAQGFDICMYGNKELSSKMENLLRNFVKLWVFLTDYLDRTLPLEKIDIVVLPNFVLDRHANSWGLIFSSDYLIPNDWSALHGLLDQWFHHFVSPQNFYSPLEKALHKFMLWESGLTNWNPSDRLSGLLDDYASSKMSTEQYEWLLRMLNYSLSAETFRLGLRNFVSDRQAFATYTDSVLWYFLTESGHNQNTLDSSVSVKDIAYSWVGVDSTPVEETEISDSEDFSWTKADQEHILSEEYSRQDHIPLLTVLRNYEHNMASVEQSIFLRKRMNSNRIDSFWWIPVMYFTSDHLDTGTLNVTTWMKGRNEARISGLPSKDSFIIVNPEYAGMFVVNYDEHNWKVLMEYLNSDNYEKIPEMTRSKLLYDVFNLAYFGEVDIVTALNMSLFLSKETSKIVWEPFLDMINEFVEYISDTPAEPLLEKYILKQLLRAKSSGADWIPYHTLCRYGYEACIASAREDYNIWMEQDDIEYKITYDNFCYTFKYGNMDEYEFGIKYLTKYDIKDKWNYSNLFFLLQTLALCPMNTEKINRYFDVIFVEKNDNITDEDIMTILIRFRNHAQGRWMAMLDFVTHNFASVKDRLAKEPHIWNLLITEVTKHFITQEGLNEVVAFHKNHKGILGGVAEPNIQSSKFKIATEVTWSSKNLKVMETWLRQQVDE